MACAISTKCYRSSVHAPRILHTVLRNRGVKRNENDYNLYWRSGCFSRDEFANAQSHHLLNHFPETRNITRKGHLQFLLKKAYAQYGQVYDFTPPSFVLTNESLPLVTRYFANDTNKLWIGKPATLSRGRGILITKYLNDFVKYLNPKEEEQQQEQQEQQDVNDITTEEDIHHQIIEQQMVAQGMDQGQEVEAGETRPYVVIVQEYINNPHLVRGYKHDMRIYVLLKSLKPLRIYLFNEGLSRFCTEKFSLEDLDPMRHLTNTSIHHKMWQSGKLNPSAIELFNQEINSVLGNGDFSKRRLRSLFAYFHEIGLDYRLIWRQIKKVIMLTLLPLLQKTETTTHTTITTATATTESNCQIFELLGFDILLTNSLKPMLVEVNKGPSLGVHCETDLIIKKALLEDMMDMLLLDIPSKKQRWVAIDEDPLCGGCDYDGDGDRFYGDFELIFPFNQTTETASQQIASGINVEQNLRLILNQINTHFGDTQKHLEEE